MRFLAPILLLLATACAASKPAEQPAAAPKSEPAPPPTEMTDRYSMQGCTGEVEHDTWTMTCPQFVLSRTIIDWDPTWTRSLILNTTLATLREGAETVGSTSDRRPAVELNVDGGHGYRMKIETGEGDSRQVFGMTTYARPLDEDHVVGVICMDLEQTTAERCEELSVWFASELPQIEWVDMSRPMQFAGRRVSAAPGCEADGESTIVCGSGAELLWFEREDDDSPTAHQDEAKVVFQAIVRVNKERTGQQPVPTEEGFDCRLDGELGDCHIYRYDYGGNALYIVTGVGQVRGRDVSVLCDWTSDLTDDIPIPCSLLVDPTLPDPLTEEL